MAVSIRFCGVLVTVVLHTAHPTISVFRIIQFLKTIEDEVQDKMGSSYDLETSIIHQSASKTLPKTAMAAARRRATTRNEIDLDAMVTTGPSGAYEALQLYRSRALRFRSKNDLEGAIKATASGAVCLLKNSYATAGAELSSLLVDMLDEEGKDIDASTRSIIYDVDNSFPAKAPQQIEFLKSCVKWTTNCGTRELGDPQLHVRLANCMWAVGDKNAIYHFAAGEAPEDLAARLEESYGAPEQQEPRDRGLALGVLHFLALENLRDANDLMDSFKRTQKAKKLDPKSELLTFLDYLLQTCRRDAQPLFKTLVNKYSAVIDFDETAPALLMGPIGQRLFGIVPRVNPMMSMLQNMLN